MLTTDKNDKRLSDHKEEGQNDVYLILSEDERQKGFVRPVRKTYRHIGRYYSNPPVMLDKPYNHGGKIYVATIPTLIEDGKVKGSRYITAKEVEQYNITGGYIGGCGVITTMAAELAETYARNPKFYSQTFCCGCNIHIPVDEFVWDGTDEKVGS